MSGEKIRNSKDIWTILAVLTIILIISFPIILKVNFVQNVFSWYLNGLKTIEYRVAYINFIAVIFGTFLAVNGALATQRYLDSKKKTQKIIKNAQIIYFDFTLTFEDLIIAYIEKTDKDSTMQRDLYLYDNWIDITSDLPCCREGLEKIFILYGELHTLKNDLHNGVKWNYDVKYTVYPQGTKRTEILYKKYFLESFFSSDNINSLKETGYSSKEVMELFLKEEYKNLISYLNAPLESKRYI